MAIEHETQMSDAEIDDFVSRHETGVLALARDDDPYAIPISYGYDPETRTVYLRLVSTPESEKRAFLSSEPTARLVVYDETADAEPSVTTYRSVVAEGDLVEIQPDELTVEHVQQYGEAKRPLFEIWAESKPDLDIALYELSPTSIQGRRVDVERE